MQGADFEEMLYRVTINNPELNLWASVCAMKATYHLVMHLK